MRLPLQRTGLRLLHALLERRVQRRPELALEWLGSRYGGRIVPTALPGREWICYSGGVGEDITFDEALIERFGCQVYAFDPTPRAIEFVMREAPDPATFHFMPLGLWSEDTTLRFHAPRDPAHVSHSVINLQGTDKWFEAPCRSLASLMAELGHERIDLLKLDIEGAEHAVLSAMLDAGIRPSVVCLEIDRPVTPGRAWTTVRRLMGGGYALVGLEGWDLTFVLGEALRGRRISPRVDPA